MARTKPVRSVIMCDEVFNGLKTAAAVKNTSISKLLENLAREYLTTHREEIRKGLQQQMSLFELIDPPSDDGNPHN